MCRPIPFKALDNDLFDIHVAGSQSPPLTKSGNQDYKSFKAFSMDASSNLADPLEQIAWAREMD